MVTKKARILYFGAVSFISLLAAASVLFFHRPFPIPFVFPAVLLLVDAPLMTMINGLVALSPIFQSFRMGGSLGDAARLFLLASVYYGVFFSPILLWSKVRSRTGAGSRFAWTGLVLVLLVLHLCLGLYYVTLAAAA